MIDVRGEDGEPFGTSGRTDGDPAASEEAGGDASSTGTEAGGSQSMEGEFRVRISLRGVSPEKARENTQPGVTLNCDGRPICLLEQFGDVIVRESDLLPILQ